MLKAYYWQDVPNWGDLLTPLLLAYFSHLAVEWAPVENADIVGVGSVLEHIPPGWDGKVVGSGRLVSGSPLHLGAAQVLAVRGPFSAAGIRGSFALGDPGLLADEMISVETRDVRLGVIPHWSDTELAHNWAFAQYNPLVISPFDPPEQVMESIGRCEKIVSSSLHGIILADAFGIPRRTELARRFAENPHEGGTFKFADYNASVGLPFRLEETQQPKRGAIENRKHEIYDVLRSLRYIL